MQKISKGFYMGSVYGGYFGAVVLMIIYMISIFSFIGIMSYSYSYGYNSPFVGAPIGVLLLAGFSVFAGAWLFLFSFVTENILIYRLWDTIRGKTARITPGRAVTYIYIPFFGFYWIYQAYWGCAVDYNRYIVEKKVDCQPVSEGVPLALCILSTLSLIPYVIIITGIPILILRIIWYNQMIDAGNQILVKD